MAAIRQAVAGIKGLDVNAVLTEPAARAFHAAGYRFAMRYLGRRAQGPHDASANELIDILGAGLAVGLVQHVESESSWAPDAGKGADYGAFAATAAMALGYYGGQIWLDLEGVAPGTPASDVDAYCRAWLKAVVAQGFKGGVYVGWRCGLGPAALYALPVSAYWAAYNLNLDQYPAVRGCQMRQRVPEPEDLPPGASLPIDVDMVRADQLGGLPFFLAPDGWDIPQP